MLSRLLRSARRDRARERRLAALLVLLVLWPAALLQALDPHKQLGQYGHDSWTSQRGLRGEAVFQILQSRDGYLWFRTSAGLSRFDGVRFTSMDQEIGDESVRAIAMGADGDLLIRTTTRTVIYRDRAFFDYLPPAPLPDGGIRVLFQGRDHTVLLGSDDFIYRLNRSGPSMLRRGTAWVNSILEDHTGKIWIGSDTSLFTYKDGQLSQPLDIAKYGSGITALLEDSRNRLWAGTMRGLYQLAGEPVVTGQSSRPAAPGPVTAAIEDRQGNLWVGTESSGVVRLTDGQASSMDSVAGLTDSNVLSLFEDREGSLWIGTASGLDRLRDTKVSTFGVKEGLPANYAKSALATRDGSVYVFTKIGGLTRIQKDKVTPFVFNRQLPPIYADALYEGRDGSLWMGTDKGLTRFKDGKLTVYPGTIDGIDHFARRHISAIVEDKESLIVTTSELATFRFKDGRIYPFTLRGAETPFTKPGLYTFALHADPSGTLWFGTSVGLYRLVPGAPMLSAPQPEAAFAVTSIYNDQQGNLWLGGRIPGLVRFHIADGHATHYAAKQGLFDSYLSHILPDEDGNLWISTQDGIYAVPRQQLEDVASGRAKTVSARVYGLADGMKTTQASDPTAQPSGTRTADGRLWFTTYKGIVSIDPRHLLQNNLIPPVVIESVIVDGARQPLNGDLTIAPGAKSIEFDYSAISLNIPERVRFRYRLEGYDHGWVEAGSRRVAYYTNLPPGRYRFRVIAANDDSIWNQVGASIDLVLKPQVYQTWWFRTLCALWLMLAIVAAYRRNTARIRARAEEMARLVDERTAELRHSQNELRQLAHIDTLTALPNRRMFTEDFGNMRATMRSSRFSLLLIDFDRFKHINDTYGHDAGDAFLIEASMRLRAAVRSSDRVARLGGDEFAILLTGDHDQASVEAICERILQSFADAVEFRGTNITTSASVGVAVFPDDGESQEDLYKSADLALYQAKRMGRNHWRRYSPQLGLESPGNPPAPTESESVLSAR